MPDNELKGLLAGLFADIPVEKTLQDSRPETAVDQQDPLVAEALAARFQAAAEVSRIASSILDADELLHRVASLVRSHFDLTFVGVFLLDKAGEFAVLRAATGAAGEKMLKEGHSHTVGGDSTIGKCLDSAQACVSLDTGQEAVGLNHHWLSETRSEVALPLISREQIIGALTLQSAEMGAFADQDINILQAMADQVANALENARLYQETQVARSKAELQALRLTTLNELSEELNQAEGIKQILDIAASKAIELFDADRASVAMLTADDDGFEVFEINGQHLPVTARLVRRSDEAPMDRAVLEQRLIVQIDDQSGQLEDVSSLMVAPLLTGEKVVGTLNVVSAQSNASEQHDGSLLLQMASLLSSALENQCLLDEAQQRLNEMTMLSNLSRALAGAPLKREQIAEIVCRQFVDEMSISEASISVLDPATGRLDILADIIVEGADYRREHISETFLIDDYPATARVLQTLQTEVVQASDVSADPAELAYMKDHGIETLAILPLASKGQAFGVIELEEVDQERHLSTEEINLAVTLANQAAVALENARLLQEAQESAEEQATLRRITETVSRSLDLQELLDTVLGMALTSLGFDSGLVSLTDEKTGHLYLGAHQELPEPLAAKLERDGLEDTLCDHVLHTGETMCIADVRQGAPVDVTGLIAQGLVAYAGTRLEYKGESVGTICFFDRSAKDITSRELALLEAIGNQIAVGVANARLLREAQLRAKEQAILNEVGQALTACREVDSLLDEMHRGASRLLEAENCYITLYDAERNEITLALKVFGGQSQRPNTTLPMEVGGLTEYLLSSRQPLLLTRRQGQRMTELRLEQFPLRPDLPPASWLGVPLVVGDRAIGTIVTVSFSTPGRFDEHDQDLLVALADRAAVSLENIGLLEQTRAALVEVEATHQSYVRYGWQQHLRQSKGLAKSEFLYDQSDAGPSADLAAALEIQRPEIERAVLDGGPAATGERGDDGERTGLVIPISIRGQTIGVVGVESPSGDRKWTTDDVAFVQAVSEQLGQTLESARLFAVTQRRAERERLIGDITAKIRASTDMHDILETAAVELGQALGTSRALIRVGLEELDAEGQGNDSQPLATSKEDTHTAGTDP